MRGVTLIEIMIVLGISALLMGASIGPGLQEFDSALAQSDGTRMAALARHARAEAMHGTAHSLSWSGDSDALTVQSAASASNESYPLAGNEGIAAGTITFLGPEGTNSAGSIELAASSSGLWEIDTDTAGAITIQHSL